MQGWSGTLQPEPKDPITNVMFNGLKVEALPAGVNDNLLFTDIDITKLHQQSGFIRDNDENSIFEEEILTVNQDGKVIITIVTAPELCSLFGHVM
jgi:hypothetical protein